MKGVSNFPRDHFSETNITAVMITARDTPRDSVEKKKKR